jgi:hypothetical protein
MAREVPEPTELIYEPRSSWVPVVVAAGITIAAVGAFAGLVWALIGIVLLLGGMRAWSKIADDEISRMRREQRTETSVIPAEPIRRSSAS